MESIRKFLHDKGVCFVDKGDSFVIEDKKGLIVCIRQTGNEYLLDLDKTHCHCETNEEVLSILNDIFSDKLKLVYQFRGDVLVGSQIQVIENNNTHVFEESGVIFVPFWKKKRYEEIRFEFK